MDRWERQFLEGWFRRRPVDATLAGDHRFDCEWGPAPLDAWLVASRAALPATGTPRRELALRLLDQLESSREHGDDLRDLGTIGSTLQSLLLAYEQTVPRCRAARRRSWSRALASYRSLLTRGLERGAVVSAVVVRAVLDQCDRYTGELPLGDLTTFLRFTYLPRASPSSGVGLDYYRRCARTYLGSDVDLRELYRYGYSEVSRVRRRLAALPVTPVPTVATVEEHFALVQAWLEEARTLVAPVFDVVPPVPALALDPVTHQISYLASGTILYDNRYPRSLLLERSTAFHEGIPGHHLLTHVPRVDRSQLEEVLVSYPAYQEGFALYGERLMEELGAFEGYHLRGRLLCELWRSFRVVIDLGLHLGLDDALSGEPWSLELASSYLLECGLPREQVRDEVERYLSLPAQAISYKYGERLILERRARHRGDLRSFHRSLLTAGSRWLFS